LCGDSVLGSLGDMGTIWKTCSRL